MNEQPDGVRTPALPADEPRLQASTLRRIVIGEDASGRSVVLADGATTRQVRFDTAPGLCLAELWATSPEALLKRQPIDPTDNQERFVPPPGGTLFRIFEEPPGAPDGLPPGTTIESFLSEALVSIPGLAETLETASPGMHTTDSVDYVVVLRGRGALELDGGVMVELSVGDCVIQNGARHRWHNIGAEPFVAAAVMVGAHRHA